VVVNPDPGFDTSLHDYVQHMVGYLWGAQRPGGGSPNETRSFGVDYFDVLRGAAFTAANVTCHLQGAYEPFDRPGSVVVAPIVGPLLPLTQVSPARHEMYEYAASQPVALADAEFNRRFRVRSGHPDFAATVIAAWVPYISQRDDWAFLLYFNQLVCVSSTAFDPGGEMGRRGAELAALVAGIPPWVGQQWGVAAGHGPTDAQLLTPENQARAKAIVDAMPREQRQQLIAQIRAEGADAVFRRLLDM
jgi:hypothetical protein